MIKDIKAIWFAIFISFLFSHEMYPLTNDGNQEPHHNSSIYGWLYAGVGITGYKYNSSPAGIVGFSYVNNNIIRTFRVAYAEEFPKYYPQPHSPGTVGKSDSFGYMDAGLLYGYSANTQYVMISASTGISFLRGGVTIKDEYRRLFTAGIPLEINLFISPLPLIGIGFTGYGNINYVSPFLGYMVCVQLGKVW